TRVLSYRNLTTIGRTHPSNTCVSADVAQAGMERLGNFTTLIGSRALAAYGDVDGPSAANNRPWSRRCAARLLRRPDASASAHGCGGTRSAQLAGAGNVG